MNSSNYNCWVMVLMIVMIVLLKVLGQESSRYSQLYSTYTNIVHNYLM